MDATGDESAVSPLVAVILVIAITVLLAGSIFVLLSDSFSGTSAPATATSDFSSTNTGYTVTVTDGGTAETLTYRINGDPLVTLNNPAENVGTSIDLSQYSQFCEGDELTVIGTRGGSDTLLQTTEVDSNEACTLSNTSANSQVEFDGDSWIVNTSLLNRADEDRDYTIVLTDGETYETLETTTVSGHETTVISGTTSTFDEGADLRVGVISSSYSSDSGTATLTSTGDGSYTWSGGSSAGHSFYSPYSSSTSYSESQSSDDSTDSSSSISSPSTSETGSLGLSASRVAPGETVNLYATLATTKETADETLVVYATDTDGNTNEEARSTYTLTADDYRNVTEPFAIDTPGEYIITASLVGDDEVVTAGPLTVVDTLGVSLDSADVSTTTVDAGESVTVSGVLSNSGPTDVTTEVEVFQDGESYTVQDVTIPAGGTTTVNEDITLAEIRDYQFHIGVPETAAIEKAGTVTAEDPSLVDVSVSATSPAYVDESVGFTADATHEDGSAIVEYQWDFGDGTTETTESNTASHTFTSTDEYTYTVTAIAEDGEQDSAQGQLTTIDTPTASASASEETVSIEEQVDFSAAGTEVTGDATFEWDFGDGSTATGTAVSHEYTTGGSYDVELTVTETDSGRTDTDTVSVEVTVPTNLVGYWQFDETSGNTLTDYSENNNHGTIHGNMVLGAEGHEDGTSAYQFNGNDAYVTVSEVDGYEGDQFSFTAWVYLEGSGQRSIMDMHDYNSLGQDGEGKIHIEQEDSTNFRATLKTSSGNGVINMRDAPSMPEGEWVFLVVRYDGTDAEMSFNGEVVATDSGTGDIADTEDFQFGMHKKDRWFEGRMSEIRVYNEFLTDEELQAVREDSTSE